MRRPTPVEAQLRWWRQAIAEDASQTEHIECGFFKMRERARSQTWLPARIYLLQPIDWETGELTGPETFALDVAGTVMTDQNRVWDQWLRLRPVSLSEWCWLTARLSLHKHLYGTERQAFTSDYF